MPLIPYAEFAFDVDAPAPEVRERLRAAVGRGHEPRQDPPPPFDGDVDGASFAVRRRLEYRNSFRPEIRGRTEATAHGAATRVSGRMRLHLGVLAFAAVWLGAIGVGCVRALASFAEGTPADAKALVLPGMFLFGYTLMTGGFSSEARYSLQALRKAVGGRNQPPPAPPPDETPRPTGAI